MVKALTKVGNSKALIIPAELIKKYGLDEVVLEEKEDGILIKSAVWETNFLKAANELRKQRRALYERVEAQANKPETVEYYGHSEHNLSEVDLTIIEKQ